MVVKFGNVTANKGDTMNDEPVKNVSRIEVVSMTDHEDGSATVVFDMDAESLKKFAEIGLLKVLTDHANNILKDEVDDNVGC